MPEHIAELPEKLRAGQTKGIWASIDHFHTNDRGVLWMACGTGKTVGTAVTIELRGEPLTVVFTPYIHLVKQWKDDYLKWLPTTKAKFLCICSEKDTPLDADPLMEAQLLNASNASSAEEFANLVADAQNSNGQTQITTNPEEIASFLKQDGRKVVFCTYNSSKFFGEAQRLADTYADFGVFDEAHMTASGDKDSFYTHALHDDNVRIAKRLFTTATVRHFTRRDERIYSMDNEEIYGTHILVDASGKPDPWTTRHAIEHKEVAPYRVVLSFVTDPNFDAGLVQLPPYRELMEDLKAKADPAEVLRLIGHAIALEKAKAKYGVQKPLGFFSNVATSRLYTDVLNACKKYPEYFPLLAESDTAVSVSTYEPRSVRDANILHLHNSTATEINNVRLLVMGTSENTIDAISINDPMTSNIFIIQAAGRAMRYVPHKIATIIVPVMLPYFENDLADFAQRVEKDQIKDAFRHAIGVLDGLAEMDPILQDQIMSGNNKVGGNPKIIEFEFPETFLPEVRDAIEIETWKTVNPYVDVIFNWPASPENQAFQKLRQDKGDVGGETLYKIAQQDDEARDVFASPWQVRGIAQGKTYSVPRAHVVVLTALLEKMDVILNWPSSIEFQSLQKLLKLKGRGKGGNVGARMLYGLAEEDENTKGLFVSEQAITNIIDGRNDNIHRAQFTALTYLLEQRSDAIMNWGQSAEYRTLSQLRERKGNIGEVNLYQLAQQDEEAKAIFSGTQGIRGILTGQTKTVLAIEVKTLTRLLESHPDAIINWPESQEFSDLNKLRREKGNAGARILYRMASQTASTNGIFATETVILNILLGKITAVPQPQLQALIQLYGQLPDKERAPLVDLNSGTANRTRLDELVIAKGSPSAYKIFNAMPAEAKQPDENGVVLFRYPAAIEPILDGSCTSLNVGRYEAVIVALESMKYEQIINIREGSPDRKILDSLWEEKGKPSAQKIYKSLPPEAKLSDANGEAPFSTPNTIHSVLEGHGKRGTRQHTLSRRRYEFLVAGLQAVTHKPPSVDLNQGTPELDRLMTLWHEKGTPTSSRIFKAVSGKRLFKSVGTIKFVLTGQQKSLSQPQYDAVIAALNDMDSDASLKRPRDKRGLPKNAGKPPFN